MWNPFINNVFAIHIKIIEWVSSLFSTIRSTPFLLFTVGFVVVGYCVILFGRLLSHD